MINMLQKRSHIEHVRSNAEWNELLTGVYTSNTPVVILITQQSVLDVCDEHATCMRNFDRLARAWDDTHVQFWIVNISDVPDVLTRLPIDATGATARDFPIVVLMLNDELTLLEQPMTLDSLVQVFNTVYASHTV